MSGPGWLLRVLGGLPKPPKDVPSDDEEPRPVTRDRVGDYLLSKGYRFIAAVDVETPATPVAVPPAEAVPSDTQESPPPPPAAITLSRVRFAVVAIVLAGVAGFSVWAWQRTEVTPSDVTLAVLPFDDLSGNPEAEYLANGLAEEVIVALGRVDPQGHGRAVQGECHTERVSHRPAPSVVLGESG